MKIPPNSLNLHDTVVSMMIDLSDKDRERVERGAKEAIANPEDFAKYMIIQVCDTGQDLEALLDALSSIGLIKQERERTIEDGPPSA